MLVVELRVSKQKTNSTHLNETSTKQQGHLSKFGETVAFNVSKYKTMVAKAG